MPTITLPCFYLAPVSYYSALFRNGGAFLEVCDTYVKQTPRNRCVVDSPQGPLTLTVPVEHAAPGTPVRDIRISDHGNWRRQHWQALSSSYSRSPFFEYYADDFAPLYERKRDFLADFNEDLLRLACSIMDIGVTVRRTEEYVPQAGGTPYEPRPYYQVFARKHGFLPDLSIVDLIFNMGPESVLLL